jgi:ABC-type uncharacterized transport system fused permease/ATPase subunit
MLISGFSDIFNLLQDVSKLCGYATRIAELIRIIVQHEKHVRDAQTADRIEMSRVTIAVPLGDILIPNLSFVVRPGDSMFISGPSGIGKSSLFRVLGQVWPVSEGTVTIPHATPENLLIITQFSYLPLCSQMDCCCFPKPPQEVSLDQVNDAVSLLGLSDVMARPEQNWQAGLSPGERQRLCLVRVFVHRPRFLLLDEATSAIPQDLEAEVFARIRDMGIALITIAHNQELRRFHRYSLDLDEQGRYELREN